MPKHATHNSLHNNLHGISDILQRKGIRVTGARRAVLAYLCKQSKPVSVKDIEAAVPKANIVTLYRILDMLVVEEIVRELTHDPKEKFFELADPFHEHHHHYVCRRCGKVSDLQCKLTLPPLTDFVPEMHVVTVYGHCKKC